MNKLKNLVKEYFFYFSNKDISNLRNMFDDNINLRDWEINAKGIDSVCQANLKIFNSVETINVSPKLIVAEDKYIFAELGIIINNNELINVVDIIEFNNEQKIINIRAFKG